jgi:3-oxoacyl-[acyl-carrier protein] reductase
MIQMSNVALVTGASGGIGRAICLELAKSGFDVAIHCNSNTAMAEQIKVQICDMGQNAEVFQADLKDPAQCQFLVDKCVEAQGPLYALVNNAGITDDGLLMRMTDMQYHSVMQTNLDSCFYMTRATLPLLLRARKGRIVNITSVVGMMGNAGQANYVAAKAGMIGFTKACAREVASRGICVNAVAPGFIETAMTEKLPDEIRQKMKQTIPLMRFGTPEDVANMVGFLCSDRASYITGQVLVIDGGMTMQG